MMVINEPSLAQNALKRVPKLWGVEFWVVNNDEYCWKILKLNPGYESSVHCHRRKDETFVGISGTAWLRFFRRNGTLIETHIISEGKQTRIPRNTYHSFEAINQAWISEVSTPHDDDDVIRLRESRKVAE